MAKRLLRSSPPQTGTNALTAAGIRLHPPQQLTPQTPPSSESNHVAMRKCEHAALPVEYPSTLDYLASRQRRPSVKKPKACNCAAYSWPHRPGGGLCCWPSAPKRTCSTPAGTNRRGIARTRKARSWMFRRWGLNPVADREEFVRLYPVLQRYSPRTLDEARATLAYLRSTAPDHLVVQPEPGSWRWLPRDIQGRWMRYPRRFSEGS